MADQVDKPGEDWVAYFDAVAGLPARETLMEAVRRFEGGGYAEREYAEDAEETQRNAEKKAAGGGGGVRGAKPVSDSASLCANSAPSAYSSRLAVDLGCGEGRDTFELLRRGWRVLAIDGHPEAIARLVRGAPEEAAGRLETRVARFEDAALPVCDLVNASFSIPHCAPADFPALWAKIAAAIRTG
jgi:SAM-dependent methyltransferase